MVAFNELSRSSQDTTGGLINSIDGSWTADCLLRLTPETSIVSLTPETRLVIVLDVSPSMSVVDRTKVILTIAFETICKCLHGLTQQFEIGARLITPQLHLSIIADASGFAGSLDSQIVPMATLIHDIAVTTTNLVVVAEYIYDAIIDFENRLLQQGLRKASVFTALDSGGTTPELLSSPTVNRQSQRTIWNSFETALCCLNTLPQNLFPSILFITDGVSFDSRSMQASTREICSRIACDNVNVNIVQIGSSEGFSPDVNLGHVPNTEFLRFVASALYGNFFYASDCPYMDYPSEELNVGNASASTLPNFYHQMFLMREKSLEKLAPNQDPATKFSVLGNIDPRNVDIPRVHIINNNIPAAEDVTFEETDFPWCYSSKPPVTAEILCGFRDYVMPDVSLMDVLSVRIQQGFRLDSFYISHKPGRSSKKIEIILALHWMQHVTIQYTIKFSWPVVSADGVAEPVGMHTVSNKPLKIELNILAHHSFAVVFINVLNFDKRDDLTTSFHEVLNQLLDYLKEISETDESLRVLSAFNSKEILSVSVPSRGDARALRPAAQSYIQDLPSNYWPFLSQTVHARPWLVSDWKYSVLLMSTSSSKQGNKFLKLLNDGSQETSKARRQVALIYLSQFLSSWSTITITKTSFMRFIFDFADATVPSGFCFINLVYQTECLMILNLRMFNVDVSQQRKLIQDLKSGIADIEHTARLSETSMHPIINCEKPLHELLVRYELNKTPAPYSESSFPGGLITPDLATPQQYHKPNNYNVFSDAFRILTPEGRNLQRLRRWVWFQDLNERIFDSAIMNRIFQIAFEVIYNTRTDDGFAPISESVGCITLYREVSVTTTGNVNRSCSVQFILLCNPEKRNFTTELWMEPIATCVEYSGTESEPQILCFYDKLADSIERIDRYLLTRVFTFELVQNVTTNDDTWRVNIDERLEALFHSNFDFHSNQVVRTQLLLPAIVHGSPFTMHVYHVMAINDGCDEDPMINGLHVSAEHPQDQESAISFKSHPDLLNISLGDFDIRPTSFQKHDDILSNACPIKLSAIVKPVSPAARFNMVLYGFLSRAIANITEKVIDISHDGEKSFHEQVSNCQITDILEQASEKLKETYIRGNVFLVRGLRNSVSYVNHIGQNRFLMAVLHRYELPLSEDLERDIQPMDDEQNASIETHYFTISLFECVKPNKASSKSKIEIKQAFSSDSLCSVSAQDTSVVFATLQCDERGQFIRLPPGFILARGESAVEDSSYQKTDFNSVDDSQHTRGFSQESQSSCSESSYRMNFPQGFTLESEMFSLKLNNAFAASFSKTLFLALLQGSRTTEKDVLRAFDAFHKTVFTVDFTDLIKSFEESSQSDVLQTQNDSDMEYLNIVAKHFEPLSRRSASAFASKFLFYRGRADNRTIDGSSTASISSSQLGNQILPTSQSFDTPESIEQYRSMVDLADTPLFVNIECVFSRDSEQIIIPALTSLPQRYPTELACDLSKTDREPGKQAELSAKLNINCWNLFPIEEESPDILELSVSEDMRQSIYELKRDIENLTKDLLLANILQSRKFRSDDNILGYVQNIVLQLFSDGIADIECKDTMPVSNPKMVEGSGAHFRIYLSFLSEQDCLPLFQDNVLSMCQQKMTVKQIDDNKYCILDSPTDGASINQKFWLFLVSDGSMLHVYYFYLLLSIEERIILMDYILESVYKCVERVNRIKLLNDVHESHVISDLLVPLTALNRVDADVYFSTESAEDGDIMKPAGRFSCPNVYEKSFQLHWRVPPAQALNSIVMALLPLSVTNRRHMFVYSTSASVYYMEIDVYIEQQITPRSSVEKTQPNVIADKGPDTDEQKATVSKSKNFLQLKVFGVDEVGAAISTEFVNMLESKLISLTQSVLGMFLSRNYMTKLNKEDLNFIFPSYRKSGPSKTAYYLLPIELENPFLFLLLLRQVFLTFTHPLTGPDVVSGLLSHYEAFFGHAINDHFTIKTNNEMHVGYFSFLYNAVPTRHATSLEVATGNGIASIAIVLIDGQGEVMFPTKGAIPIQNKVHINLDNFEPSERVGNLSETENWEGYKVCVQIWTQGTLNLDALLTKIDSIIHQTSSDYAVESYFRSTNWMSVPLNDALLNNFNNSDQPIETGENEFNTEAFSKPLDILPKILSYSFQKGNPVVQAFQVSTELPLDTVTAGMFEVLHEEGLQVYFFSKDMKEGPPKYVSKPMHKQKLELLMSMQNNDTAAVSNEQNEIALVAATSFNQSSNILDRKSSLGSDLSSRDSSSVGYRESLTNIVRASHNRRYSLGDETASESSSNSGSPISTRRSSKAVNDNDEIFMFGDAFYPAFPAYDKRSSFVVVTLNTKSVSVYSYNWKRAETERVFLQTLKLLNWCKIHSQFQQRKQNYTRIHLARDRPRPSAFGEKLYSNAEEITLPENMTRPERKFRRLDFIYHIGSFNAINLQKQIVDFLELLFRFGKRSPNPAPTSAVSHVASNDNITSPFTVKSRISHPNALLATDLKTGNAFSLQEMSQVLQSIELIHSASAPIFFSEYRDDLMRKWETIVKLPYLDDPATVNLAKSSLPTRPIIEGQSLENVEWYKTMVNCFLVDYVKYLEQLGMEKIPWDTKVNLDNSHHGGTFAIAPKFNIEAPSVFMRKYFQNGAIIVQCGFYEYFATINVLTFECNNDASCVNDGIGSSSRFEQECLNMKRLSHIVSFSYDFHLRYFQDVLSSDNQWPFNPVAILRSFVELNQRKARFARNRIIHGYYNVKNAKNAKDLSLINYIMKNTSAYGVSPVMFCDEVVGCTLTTNNPSFVQRASETSSEADKDQDFKYTLILSKGTKNTSGDPPNNNRGTVERDSEDSYVDLEYFLLIVNTGTRFPHLEVERDAMMDHAIVHDPMREYIASGYYLHDLAQNAIDRIESLVDQATKYFGRDSLWSFILNSFEPGSEQYKETQRPEWASVFLEKILPNSRNVVDLDESLDSLFNNTSIPWRSIVRLIEKASDKRARRLPSVAPGEPSHLFVINPENSDYMLHIEYFSESEREDVVSPEGVTYCKYGSRDFHDHIKMYSVSREGMSDITEYTHINDLMNEVFYYLWNAS